MSMNHTVYPVGNLFGTKAAKEVKYPTVDAQMERLQTKYQARAGASGMLSWWSCQVSPFDHICELQEKIRGLGIGANRAVSLSHPKHRTTTRIFCC